MESIFLLIKDFSIVIFLIRERANDLGRAERLAMIYDELMVDIGQVTVIDIYHKVQDD